MSGTTVSPKNIDEFTVLKMTDMIRVQIPDFFEIGIPLESTGSQHSDCKKWAALINLRWVLSCWASAINDACHHGSPRRVETHNKIEQIFAELRPHLDEEQWYQVRKGLVDEETGKTLYP